MSNEKSSWDQTFNGGIAARGRGMLVQAQARREAASLEPTVLTIHVAQTAAMGELALGAVEKPTNEPTDDDGDTIVRGLE